MTKVSNMLFLYRMKILQAQLVLSSNAIKPIQACYAWWTHAHLGWSAIALYSLHVFASTVV